MHPKRPTCENLRTSFVIDLGEARKRRDASARAPRIIALFQRADESHWRRTSSSHASPGSPELQIDPGAPERVKVVHDPFRHDDQRGTRTLLAAAREFSAGAGHHNPNRLVGALCNRVRAYDAEGRSDYELFGLMFPLMPLAYYSSHWPFILEYGERALTIGLRITGLERARELAPELGPEEALKRGFGAAAAAFATPEASDVGYDLKTAIRATIGRCRSRHHHEALRGTRPRRRRSRTRGPRLDHCLMRAPAAQRTSSHRAHRPRPRARA